MRPRLTVLVTLLGIVAVGGLAHAIDTFRLRGQVQEHADRYTNEWRTRSAGATVVTDIFVTRVNGVYGAATAKIALYTYTPTGTAPADDASRFNNHGGEAAAVQGIWYFYEQRGDVWQMTESASISAAECREGAPAAFKNAGINVPESAWQGR